MLQRQIDKRAPRGRPGRPGALSAIPFYEQEDVKGFRELPRYYLHSSMIEDLASQARHDSRPQSQS
jgi:hypothetical protein